MASRRRRRNPDGDGSSVVIISLAGAAVVAAGVWYYVKMSKAQSSVRPERLPSGARQESRGLPSSGPTDESGRDSTDSPGLGKATQGGQEPEPSSQGSQEQPPAEQPPATTPATTAVRPRATSNSRPAPTSSHGAVYSAETNASTREASTLLTRIGYSVFGDFSTRVRSFQERYNRENIARAVGSRPGPVIQPSRLTVDGRVGPSTLTALRNYVARLNASR